MPILPERRSTVSAGQTPGRRVPVLPPPQAPPGEQRRVMYTAVQPKPKEQPVATPASAATSAPRSSKQILWMIAALLPVVVVFAVSLWLFDWPLLVALLLSAVTAAVMMFFLIRKVSGENRNDDDPASELDADVAEPAKPVEQEKVVKAVKPKKPKSPPWEPKHWPEGPQPEHGVSGFVWHLVGRRLYSWKQWEWTVWRTLNDRLHYLDRMFYENRGVQKTAAVFNKKGGAGKTPVTTWLSALLGRVFKGASIVGVDNNTGGGHLVDLFNIKRSVTLTIRQYLSKFRELTTPAIIQAKLERHWKTGTWLIASDTSATNRIDLSWFIDGMKHLKTLFFWVFADTGNDPYNNATLATLYCVDTAILAGNTANKYTLSDVIDTMETFKRLGFEDKMRHAVIVILGASPRKRRKFAADFNHPLSQVYCIPKSPVMMTGTDEDVAAGNFKEMDIDALPKRVLVPLLEALLAIVLAESVKTTMSVQDLENKVAVEVEVMSNGQPIDPDAGDADELVGSRQLARPNLQKEISSKAKADQVVATVNVVEAPVKPAAKPRAPRRPRTTPAAKTQMETGSANGLAPIFTTTSTGTTLLDTRSQEEDDDSGGSQP